MRVLATSPDLPKHDSPFPGAFSVSSLHDAYIGKPPGFSEVCAPANPLAAHASTRIDRGAVFTVEERSLIPARTTTRNGPMLDWADG